MASFLLQALDQIPGASVAIDPITSVFNGVQSTASSIFGGFLGGVSGATSDIFGSSSSGGFSIEDWFLLGGAGVVVILLVKNKSKT